MTDMQICKERESRHSKMPHTERSKCSFSSSNTQGKHNKKNAYVIEQGSRHDTVIFHI